MTSVVLWFLREVAVGYLRQLLFQPLPAAQNSVFDCCGWHVLPLFCHPWVTPQAVHCPCRRRLTTCDVIHAPLGPALPTTLHPIACASQVTSHGPRHCVLLCCAGSSQSLGRCKLGVFWLSVLAYRTGALPFILAVPLSVAISGIASCSLHHRMHVARFLCRACWCPDGCVASRDAINAMPLCSFLACDVRTDSFHSRFRCKNGG